MPKDISSSPEWSLRIQRLLGDLKITQAGLAERIGVSPATVSRWVQGKHEPTAEGYITLGNLAGTPEGTFFWERAGMDVSGFPDYGLTKAVSSLRINVQEMTVRTGRKGAQAPAQIVAVPLLGVAAYGDRVPPPEDISLAKAELEEVLLAPAGWCPHPEQMVGMHLAGDSMVPVIPPKSILFVDTASTDRDFLNGKIVVVSHRDLGFKVARLQRLAGADLLVSANHRCLPLDVSNASKWKVFGEVLWWISRDKSFDA